LCSKARRAGAARQGRGTDGDNTNLTIAQIAAKQFSVPKVIVRVMDPARAEWYAEQGLHTICPTKYAIEMFERALEVKA
jgi:trk system potassium uptake protein TrkA